MSLVSSFEFKISEEINQSVESDRSDLFDQLNYCDSTSLVEYIKSVCSPSLFTLVFEVGGSHPGF